MRPGALLLSLLLVFLLSGFSGAEDNVVSRRAVITKEKKLEDVKRQIREEKQSINKIASKERTILGDIEDVNRTIVERRSKLKKVEASIKEIRNEISSTDSKIRKLEKDRSRLLKRLNSRLAAIYKMRRGEAVKVIFSSDSAEDLARRHKYLSMIMDSDVSLIRECGANMSDLEGERARHVKLKSELESTRRTYLASKREAEDIKRKKRSILIDIQREKSRRAAVVKELEQAAAELASLLEGLRSGEDPGSYSSFAALKGRLEMPVKGRVVSSYGKVRHPKFKTVTFNNGIVIDASEGDPVKSVHSGKVVYVGWLKGYGQIMIVDHGGGFYTLYAYLSKILKDRGAKVDKGEEIALVGDTGPTNSAGLYFEIRQRGVPKDPVPWFSAKK